MLTYWRAILFILFSKLCTLAVHCYIFHFLKILTLTVLLWYGIDQKNKIRIRPLSIKRRQSKLHMRSTDTFPAVSPQKSIEKHAPVCKCQVKIKFSCGHCRKKNGEVLIPLFLLPQIQNHDDLKHTWINAVKSFISYSWLLIMQTFK